MPVLELWDSGVNAVGVGAPDRGVGVDGNDVWCRSGGDSGPHSGKVVVAGHSASSSGDDGPPLEQVESVDAVDGDGAVRHSIACLVVGMVEMVSSGSLMELRSLRTRVGLLLKSANARVRRLFPRGSSELSGICVGLRAEMPTALTIRAKAVGGACFNAPHQRPARSHLASRRSSAGVSPNVAARHVAACSLRAEDRFRPTGSAGKPSVTCCARG